MAGPELTSLRAARVTAARRLARRASRSRERRFLAEGPQAVRSALASVTADGSGAAGGGGDRGDGALPAVHEVFVTAEAGKRHADLVDAARAAGVPVHRASDEVVQSLSQTVTPQGVVAVCGFLDVPLDAVVAGRPRLVAVLAHVRDPGNAGTVIRAADAAGADAVVLTDASVDPYNAKCVRATAGSLWHLPVVVGAPAADTFDALRGAGLQVLAADAAGERDLDAAADAGDLDAPTAWVFGNEAWGLPPEVLRACDGAVRVPIHGRAESLNLATAAAVTLYASARAMRRQ